MESEQDLENDVVFLEIINKFNNNTQSERSIFEPPAQQLFKQIQFEKQIQKEYNETMKHKEMDIQSKIVQALEKKLGKLSYKKYEEYERIRTMIASCRNQKHQRKRIFSSQKTQSKNKSRVFSAKKRAKSAQNTNQNKSYKFPAQRQKTQRSNMKKRQLTNTQKHGLNLIDITSTDSINFHGTPRYTKPTETPISFRTGRRMCKKTSQNIMERFKFQHQLNGILSSCQEQKTKNQTLRKKVNNFHYFCDKLHKNMEDKHKKFIAKNSEEILNLYE